MLESDIFVDMKRSQRRDRHDRLDVVEPEDARHFLDDILFDRNIFFTTERRDADAERSVGEEVRFKLN